MIDIKNTSQRKINDLNNDNYYVVADFDKTITTKDSNTTLSLFSKSGFYDKRYALRRDNNYKCYRAQELNPALTEEQRFELMKEWQTATFNLMLEYEVKEKDIGRILKMENMLTLRNGAIQFIDYLNRYNIPLIINSAGCGNFIVELLKMNNCYTENVIVHSNFIQFKDGIISKVPENIIHSMNKNNIRLNTDALKKIRNKKYAIIIGDQLSDLEMAKDLPKTDTISFGFLESNVDKLSSLFYDKFDVVLKGNETFNGINKILRLGGR